MNPPITFSLPGGFRHTQAIISLAERLRERHPHCRVQTYDTVHGLQWNGGRLTFSRELVEDKATVRYSEFSVGDLDRAVDRVRDLNAHGIPFQLTFNNTLESIDVDDDLGNHLLQALQEAPEGVTNGVTVATRALTRHVRSNYPGYALTASLCFAWRDLEEVRSACESYDKVVLMPIFAYQPEAVATLPVDKVVFILNDKCYLFCPRKEHYAYVSRCNLSGNLSFEEQVRNRDYERCYSDLSEGYRENWRTSGERDLAYRIDAVRTRHLQAEGILDERQQTFGFNITKTARQDLFRTGVRNFKLQGRELGEERYRTDVLDFFEHLVSEEFADPVA